MPARTIADGFIARYDRGVSHRRRRLPLHQRFASTHGRFLYVVETTGGITARRMPAET
jgi:hypothetical protein